MDRESPAIAPRRRLLMHIERHPGEHLRELERRTGLAVGVLRHHLDYLIEARLVVEERDGRLRRLFPVGLDAALRDSLKALRVRAHRAILVRLLNHPASSAREICDALQLAPRTTNHYLRALTSSGHVLRDDADRYQLADPDAMVRALVAYRPSFADRLVDAALEMWFDESA